MKYNIKDIARLSGVSKSTVSRYLNGGSISEKSSKKVKQVIQKTGFQPNVFARTLTTQKSRLIGMVITGLASNAVRTIIEGAEKELKKQNFQLFLKPLLMSETKINDQTYIDIVKGLVNQGIEGLLIGHTKFSPTVLKYLLSLTIPVILIGQKNEYLPYFKINDFEGGFKLGSYVKKLPVKNVTYISMPYQDKAAGIERRDGFLKAFSKEKEPQVFEAGYSAKSVYKLGSRIIKSNPDIIVCASDNMVLGMMNYLSETKTNKRILLAGFGDQDFSQKYALSLTTISFDYESVGGDAARAIVKQLNNRYNVKSKEDYAIELKIRKSTEINYIR